MWIDLNQYLEPNTKRVLLDEKMIVYAPFSKASGKTEPSLRSFQSNVRTGYLWLASNSNPERWLSCLLPLYSPHVFRLRSWGQSLRVKHWRNLLLAWVNVQLEQVVDWTEHTRFSSFQKCYIKFSALKYPFQVQSHGERSCTCKCVRITFKSRGNYHSSIMLRTHQLDLKNAKISTIFHIQRRNKHSLDLTCFTRIKTLNKPLIHDNMKRHLPHMVYLEWRSVQTYSYRLFGSSAKYSPQRPPSPKHSYNNNQKFFL